MKAIQISVQIVKNLGNYESVRLQADYALDENDDLQQAFLSARNELELSFATMCHPKQKNAAEPKEIAKSNDLPLLSIGTKEFDRVCYALNSGKTDIEQVKQHFDIDRESMDYFKKYNLI